MYARECAGITAVIARGSLAARRDTAQRTGYASLTGMTDQQDNRSGNPAAHKSHAERLAERQDAGYDEAARGGKGVPPSDVGVPNPDDQVSGDEFDRAAREAANDVRRREHSAD